MLALDHIVIASKDPAKTAQEFGKRYDVVTVQGGKHQAWGTYNHLAFFKNDSYIEWIGVYDESLANESDNPLIQHVLKALDQHANVPIQIALRTDRLHKYIRIFEEEGFSYTGPIPASRSRADGSTLNWRMLFPASETEETLPFLIEWETMKNIPNDEKLINKQRLSQVTIGITDKSIMKQIYQLETERNTTVLENALLHRTESNNLEFRME